MPVAGDIIVNGGWIRVDGLSVSTTAYGAYYVLFDAINGTNGAVFNPAITDVYSTPTVDDQFLLAYSDGEQSSQAGAISFIGGSFTFNGSFSMPLGMDGSRIWSYDTRTMSGSEISYSFVNGKDFIRYRPVLDQYNTDLTTWTRANPTRFGRLAEWEMTSEVGVHKSDQFNPTVDTALFQPEVRVSPRFNVGDGWAESMSQTILSIANDNEQVHPEQQSLLAWVSGGISYGDIYERSNVEYKTDWLERPGPILQRDRVVRLRSVWASDRLHASANGPAIICFFRWLHLA